MPNFPLMGHCGDNGNTTDTIDIIRHRAPGGPRGWLGIHNGRLAAVIDPDLTPEQVEATVAELTQAVVDRDRGASEN